MLLGGSADARRAAPGEDGMTDTEQPTVHLTFHEKLDLLKPRLVEAAAALHG